MDVQMAPLCNLVEAATAASAGARIDEQPADAGQLLEE